jgi:putative membrane protein
MSANETHRGNPAVRFALNYWAPIVLVAVSAVFIGQNRDRQQVHFLWASVESPMWLLLAVMLLVGVVVGVLLRRRH